MRKNGDGFLGKVNEGQLARGLGYFSIGLGLAELLAPRLVGRMIGMENRPKLLRFYGLREIACGVGILTQKQLTPWVWSRVAGDALDLATLGTSFSKNEGRRTRVAAATAAVAGVTALDVLCSRKLSAKQSKGIHVRHTLAVNRSPEEIYRFWRDFTNFPRFMNHLLEVRALDERRSHWKAKGPAGTTVEWDAELTEDRPNELIAWRSLPGADVDNQGVIRFERAPGNRGTFVRVRLQYEPPAGRLGAAVAMLMGEAPEKQIAVDMLRFKQLIETGEIARTEGQPAGRARSTSRKYDDFIRA